MINWLELVFAGHQELQSEANSAALSYLPFLNKVYFIKYRRLNILIIDSPNPSIEFENDDSPLAYVNI